MYRTSLRPFDTLQPSFEIIFPRLLQFRKKSNIILKRDTLNTLLLHSKVKKIISDANTKFIPNISHGF